MIEHRKGKPVFQHFPRLVEYIKKLTGEQLLPVTKEALVSSIGYGDLIGFFQFHSSVYQPYRDFFRSLFQPVGELDDWLSEPLDVLRSRGRTIVVLHLRAGDYQKLPHMRFTLVTPHEWWIKWLDEHWKQLDRPVLYVATDNAAAARESFAKYSPVFADDLVKRPPPSFDDVDISFYRDYYMLTQADVLGISNSTFSFSAAMLNDRGSVFLRPTWDPAERLVEFDPWNAEPLLYEDDKRTTRNFARMIQSAYTMDGLRGLLKAAKNYPGGLFFMARIRLKIFLGARRMPAHRRWKG